VKTLTFAIISWNAAEKLEACLRSIYDKGASVDFDIHLVDNGSGDGTVEMVRDKFPGVRLTVNQTNLGVAPARSQILKTTDAEYVLILDADTELISDNIDEFVSYMKAHPEVGIAGARLLDSRGQLQYTCRTLPRPKHVLMRRMWRFSSHPELLRHEMRDADHDSIMEVEFVIGSCQLIPGRVIGELGLLDGRMFYGFEDADYCARAMQAGYKVIYYPMFSVFHHETRITVQPRMKNLLHLYHNVRSYYLFYRKNRRFLSELSRRSLPA
jgi:GT2 family glycosyltransferase